MKILTTVKRVTDPDAKIRIQPDGSAISTEGIEYKMNPFDEIGVEESLRIKEKVGGEVIVVSIGIQKATQEIRKALAMGGDRGILVKTDEELDSDGVARILVELVKQEKPDLIVMGKQAVDDDCNQAAQLLAAYLGYPQATFAFEVKVEGDNVIVGREVDGGAAWEKVSLPAIITADLRLNEPRYAKLPQIMKAKRKKLATFTPKKLGVDTSRKVKVLRLETPPSRKAGIIVNSVDELVDLLKNEAKVI